MSRDVGGAVLEFIFLFVVLKGKLAVFANGHKSRLELQGRGGSKDETAGIDTNDCVDHSWFKMIGEQIDATGEKPGVGEEGCNVFELDAGFREIRDIPDGGFDIRRRRTSFGHV